MSKEYYKKKLIDLRADIAKEREAKKRDNERYASLIKGASSISSKASYRKQKIDRAAYHDRQIESLKRQVESTRDAIKRCN
ncbi:MAG: hypothetical protein IKK89_05010 [Alistipes sp.]|nr:hypothetical protein [Alistipes sp.]MBR6631287.1 hypothetical protein [Alistipes sp.]